MTQEIPVQAIGQKVYSPSGDQSLLSIWKGILNRCKYDKDYRARGIRVCRRWSSSFEKFCSDMGPRPSPNHSIDRKNNYGHYEAANCKWATPWEQARNKRNNRWFHFESNRVLLSDLAKRFGVNEGTLNYRVKILGWPLEKAVRTPPRQKRLNYNHEQVALQQRLRAERKAEVAARKKHYIDKAV